MTRNQPPNPMLKKNMKASSQEKANCLTAFSPPRAKPPSAPTRPTPIRIHGTFCHLDMSSLANCDVCESELISLFFKLGAFRFRHVLGCGQLTALQGPHVINNGPAILHRD